MTALRGWIDFGELLGRARRVLAVFPHPDDEAYGPAGALARAGAAPDAAAVCLCLTRGEASSMGPQRGLTPDQVGELREQRLHQVAGALHLDAMLVGDFPDSRMARLDPGDVAATIAEVLHAFSPHVVIAHDPRGVNAHADHIATHWAVRLALRDRPGTRLAMMAYPPDVVEAAKPRLMFATPEHEIDAIVSLNAQETQAKETALRIHEALITLTDDGPPDCIRRPPIERYDFLGEEFDPPLDDLFAGLPPPH